MACFSGKRACRQRGKPYIRTIRAGWMDLRQAVRIWRARSISTSVLLVLAMVGAVVGAPKMPRYYQSASSVVLLASRAASMQNGGNPFLSFSPSLTLTANAVSRELMAPGTARPVGRTGIHRLVHRRGPGL